MWGILNKEPYKARVYAFFSGIPPGAHLSLVALFRPTDLKRYRKFEVSLERVMFFARLLLSFILMDRNFSSGTGIRQA